MNIGVIGSGGREHALCFKLSQSERVNKIYCFLVTGGQNIATTLVLVLMILAVYISLSKRKYRTNNCWARDTFG